MSISYEPHSEAVIEQRVAWLSDPAVGGWFNGYREHGTTLEAQREWFNGYLQDDKRDFYTIVADGRPIGVVGLTDIDRENQQAELFIMIGEADFRGKGIGQQAVKHIVHYAFTTLGLHRVGLHVSANNVAAIACYRKAGFQEEGRLRNDRLVDGTFEDTLVMSVITA